MHKRKNGIISAFLLLLLAVSLLGCGKEKHAHECVQLILEPSTYEEPEIRDAFLAVKKASPERFKNSKILSMIYTEEIQLHMAGSKQEDRDNMVVAVSIRSMKYESAGDRAEYYCLLTREDQTPWTVESWALNRESRDSR